MNYHIARAGQQIGVFPAEDLSAKLQAGELRASDLCWAEGMTDWQPLGDVHLPPAAVENPYAPPSADIAKLPEAHGLTLATLGQRFVAALLDVVTVLVCTVPALAGSTLTGTETGTMTPAGSFLVGIGAVALVALVVYNIVLLTQQGQTLGKKWMRIRIVRFDDGANPGFVKAVLLRSFVNGIIANLVPFYGIVDVCFIFRTDRRCIHDLMAGTLVVQGNA